MSNYDECKFCVHLLERAFIGEGEIIAGKVKISTSKTVVNSCEYGDSGHELSCLGGCINYEQKANDNPNEIEDPYLWETV